MPLPPALPKPFFNIVDAALSNEISKQIARPFWLDTVGRSNLIEIRIQLDDDVTGTGAELYSDCRGHRQGDSTTARVMVIVVFGTSRNRPCTPVAWVRILSTTSMPVTTRPNTA